MDYINTYKASAHLIYVFRFPLTAVPSTEILESIMNNAEATHRSI